MIESSASSAMLSRAPGADLYTDVAGLNGIKSQARDDREGALREVARQFESLLLSQVLKSMRSANKVLAEGNLLQSNETEFYEEMFDSQLTLALTQGRSLGLADAMVRQLQGPGPEPAAPAPGATLDIRDYPRALPALSRNLPAHLQEVVELDGAAPEANRPEPETARVASDNNGAASDKVLPAAVEANTATASESLARMPSAPDAAMPTHFGSPEEFVNRLMPVARAAANELGVDPRVLVAQAALETGWGRHMIEDKNGNPSHNLFGIKADQRWAGEAVTVTTTEFREGVPLKENAAFRAYPDFGASFADYVSFLQQNPRYRQALESAEDPAAFTDALQEAGYATDPEYSRKIQTIIDGEWIQSGLNRL